MKVTTSAAMRARDVSRPHAEHLAYAGEAEASAASSRPAGQAVPLDAPGPANAAGTGAAPGDELLRETGGGDWADEAAQADGGRESGRGRARGTRRRWRPRGSGRGRAAR